MADTDALDGIIGMIMSDGEPDARMHAHAAAQALRGQRAAGELLGSVGGDTPYAQSARALGTASLQNEQQGENRMIQGAGVREQALLRRALGLDRNSATVEAARVRAQGMQGAADTRAAAMRDVAQTAAGSRRDVAGINASARPQYGQPTIGLDGKIYQQNLRTGAFEEATGAVAPENVVKGRGAGAHLDAKTAQAQDTFDMAMDRLDRLEGLFKQGIGTYPGASTLHDIAMVAGTQDPQFDVLRSLSKSHLFKGLKSDIGGRITNFEIKYGQDMFPNENDRPASALAKIAMLRQVLARDKEITMSNATAPVRGAPRAPAAAPAAAPAGAVPGKKDSLGLFK